MCGKNSYNCGDGYKRVAELRHCALNSDNQSVVPCTKWQRAGFTLP
jgi:hypothetical protein